MPKTDKELTAEIVIAYVQSWNGARGTNALQPSNLVNLIQGVYETLRSLPSDE